MIQGLFLFLVILVILVGLLLFSSMACSSLDWLTPVVNSWRAVLLWWSSCMNCPHRVISRFPPLRLSYLNRRHKQFFSNSFFHLLSVWFPSRSSSCRIFSSPFFLFFSFPFFFFYLTVRGLWNFKQIGYQQRAVLLQHTLLLVAYL